MRTLVIGDIHGCAAEFAALVAKCRYQQGQDRLVLLGDLIDKGPSPSSVVTLARTLGAETILGNHEERALRWLAHEQKRVATGKANPMNPPPHKTAEWAALDAENVAWLRSAPVTLDLGSGFLAVHGGMLPGISLAKQKPGNMLRLRYVTAEGRFAGIDGKTLEKPEGVVNWQEQYNGEYSLVVGHAVHSLESPRVDRYPNGREVWSLDTGCVHGGRLTALILETREVIQVQAEREYCPLRESGE